MLFAGQIKNKKTGARTRAFIADDLLDKNPILFETEHELAECTEYCKMNCARQGKLTREGKEKKNITEKKRDGYRLQP